MFLIAYLLILTLSLAHAPIGVCFMGASAPYIYLVFGVVFRKKYSPTRFLDE